MCNILAVQATLASGAAQMQGALRDLAKYDRRKKGTSEFHEMGRALLLFDADQLCEIADSLKKAAEIIRQEYDEA